MKNFDKKEYDPHSEPYNQGMVNGYNECLYVNNIKATYEKARKLCDWHNKIYEFAKIGLGGDELINELKQELDKVL